eukprot:100633_1
MVNNTYVLMESALGFSLFRVIEAEVISIDALSKSMSKFNTFKNMVNLESFQPFTDQEDALLSMNKISEGLLSETLLLFLKSSIPTLSSTKDLKKSGNTICLGIADANLGNAILDNFSKAKKKKLFSCRCDDIILEIIRGCRQHLGLFIAAQESTNNFDISNIEHSYIALGHSYSRSKIKYNVNRVDNMIIQAICILDQIDKDINTYCMRCKEWYGWHFPEMTKIINDNIHYCRIINLIGFRNNCNSCDLSEIIDSDTEIQLKNMSKISMGSDITQSDLNNITSLSTQVLELTEYRNELYNYLRNRMIAIAPNLTLMVGELVGARLLSHAGSLINLAKYPASTIQILGAEKALFRALKTKSDTPKYGLIYHASFVNAATQINKAKIARTLACKTSLSARVDAFSHSNNNNNQQDDIATQLWHKMEKRINFVEGHKVHVKNKILAGNIFKKHQFGDDGNINTNYDEKQDFKIGQKRKDNNNNKIYALKIVNKTDSIRKRQVEHSKTERKIYTQSNHPFIMKCHNIFETKAKLYFVLDFAIGGDLFFHIKLKTRFNEDITRVWCAEVALALGHLHALGVALRTIKPEDIVLDVDGHVQLTDFGLSKYLKPNTKAHTFCGTPEYLAPEVVTTNGHDKNVDWWTLGLLLYELTVGIPPFYDENVSEMYRKIREAPLIFPVLSGAVHLSNEIKDLICKLLQRDPKKRLGAVNDIDDIKKQPFFESIDWNKLYRKEISSGYKPYVMGQQDTSNFDSVFLLEPVINTPKAAPMNAENLFDPWFASNMQKLQL